MTWVEAVEHAYVEAAIGRPVARASAGDLARARAALGAVASRYLAVGTPRTIGLIVDSARVDDSALSLEAHRTWFAPREVRIATDDRAARLAELATRIGGAVTSIGEALASDIVCIHVPFALAAAQLRRGTHVNLLVGGTLDDDLQRIAAVTEEEPGLGALAAGLVDGRQLDEITVFVVGSAAIALAALPQP
jgi:ornithine cyclodeaminase/alanine dehydrogenase-like protein (mu-crystallin family)